MWDKIQKVACDIYSLCPSVVPHFHPPRCVLIPSPPPL